MKSTASQTTDVLAMRVTKCAYPPGHTLYGYDEITCDVVKFDSAGELQIMEYSHPELKDLCLEYSHNWRGTFNDGSRYPASFRIMFKPYNIDTASRAREIAATFTKIDKGLDKIRDEEGSPKTFGQFVARVCRILKIKQMAFCNDDAPRYHSQYQRLAIGSGVERIDRITEEMKQSHEPQQEAQAA